MEMKNSESSRKLLGNSLFYAVADILGKGIHFILLPIYTAYLTTEDYGIQNMITSFNAVMNYIVLLCLDSAALKFYSEYQEDKNILKRFYGTAMSIVLFFSGIVLITCILFQNLLVKFVFGGISFIPYVLLGLAILMLDVFYTLHRRMLEAMQEGKKVAMVGFIAVLLSSGMTVVMIGIVKLGVMGVLIATLLTSLGTVIFSLIDMRKNDMITICFDKLLAKKMLKYSLPLIPHQVSGYLAALISKIFLNISGSLSTVGLYGIATQFSSVVDVFQDATSRAYRPWLFSLLSKEKEIDKKRIRNISNILMSVYSVVTLGIGIFAQEIIWIMTSDSYHEAWRVIPVLVMVVSVRSIYYFYFAQCLYYPNTSRLIFIASMTANLCNIVSAAILVPQFGMYGSAAASMISIVVNTLIILVINRQNGDIGYNLISLIGRMGLAWIMIIIGIVPGYIYWNKQFSILNVMYKLSVIILYLILIWLFNKKTIYEFTGTKTIQGLIGVLKKR